MSFAVDAATGKLTRADRETLAGDCARAVAVDPASKHVYIATGRFSGSMGQIEGFAISPDGMLVSLPGSPYLMNGTATGLAMHPNGRFLYAASDSGMLVIDRNLTTGALVERGAFNTPKRNLALNPAGTFLTASEANSNEVSEFYVDPNTGDITAVDMRPLAQSPAGVAADPMGAFFAVTEVLDATTRASGVSTFLLNSGTHQLDKTSGSPFASGRETDAVAFDPSGGYVYATNGLDNTLSAFALNRSTGELKPIAGAPFSTGVEPDGVTTVHPH